MTDALKSSLDVVIPWLGESCEEVLILTLDAFDAGDLLAFVESLARLMTLMVLIQEDIDLRESVINGTYRQVA